MIISKKKKAKISFKMKTIPVFPQFGERFFHGKKRTRKKINFMINEDLIGALQFYLPGGERSEFMNKILEDALKDIARRKAFEGIDELRERANLRITTEEIIRLKNYGRE